jgi:hypothetical protein
MRITKVRVSRGATPDEPEDTPDEPLEMESVAEPAAGGTSESLQVDQGQAALGEYEEDLLNEPPESGSEPGHLEDDAAEHRTPASKTTGTTD